MYRFKFIFVQAEGVIPFCSFNLLPEYFLGTSIIYVLIVIVLITYNSYGLMIQKALSECMALIMFMTCYLIINVKYYDWLFWVSFTENFIKNDSLATYTQFLICFASGLYFLLSSNHLKEQRLTSFEYQLVLLFAILGLMLMCRSNDLLTTYLAIELSSLAFYILASYRKTSSYSVESGIKYFVIGAVSSAFFLLGSSFIYGVGGVITFKEFYMMYSNLVKWHPFTLFMKQWEYWEDNWLYNIQHYDYVWFIWTKLNLFSMLIFMGDEHPPYFEDLWDLTFVEIGFTFILFSLFIKLAVAPFHLWSLDVYEGSPTSSTFFFAVITKLSIIVLLMRLCYSSFLVFRESWSNYVTFVGLLSIFVGSFGGLKQRRLKTLLAYSSMSHMGYILIAFGTMTTYGLCSVLFYMVIYMLSGLCIWSALFMIRLKKKILTNKYNKELNDLALLEKSNSALAFSFALIMFSIAGIPPMIGFFVKMHIFLSLLTVSFYSVALLAILCSVVSTFYYIRIIKVIYFENLLVGKLYYPINSKKTIIFSILIFLLIFLFISPTSLYTIHYLILWHFVPRSL